MQINPQPIGKRIAERRRALGMTQRKLAATVGCSPSWIAKIEVGERLPEKAWMEKLAPALQTTVSLLAAGTDWNGRGGRPKAISGLGRQKISRRFRCARGIFDLPRACGSRRYRRGLYVTFSHTASSLASRARRRRDVDWNDVYKVRIETSGEAGWVLHCLGGRGSARVEEWSPIEVGLRLFVTSGSHPPVYRGDRRLWCLRLQDGDLEVVILPQISFLGLSGRTYRADFIIGAFSRNRVVWIDLEIDELYHEQQLEEDRLRDQDGPLETLRIPEARLLDHGLLEEVLGILRDRLAKIDPALREPGTGRAA